MRAHSYWEEAVRFTRTLWYKEEDTCALCGQARQMRMPGQAEPEPAGHTGQAEQSEYTAHTKHTEQVEHTRQAGQLGQTEQTRQTGQPIQTVQPVKPIQVVQAVCPACAADCLCPDLPRCLKCGKLLSAGKSLCLDCEAGKGPRQLDRVTAWGCYAGGLKNFIQQVKFESRPRRLQEITRALADWAIRRLPVPDGLVAVPMHGLRLAGRGFNQTEVLASALHWELGLPVIEGIEKTRATLSQAGLSRQERLLNLQDAYAVRFPGLLQGRIVWVVDDVTTTGTTLDTLAGVLRKNGVQKVYGLCLAAGRERCEKSLKISSSQHFAQF